LDEKFVRRDLHGFSIADKTEKRTRNKDRPDRGVWTPLRRSDSSHSGIEHSSSSVAQPTPSNPESVEGI
jgi:regulator of nonsense transcripts 3